MKPWKIGLLATASVVVAAVIAYLLRQPILTYIVIPVIHALQAISILLGFFSPLVYWAAFLLVLAVLAYRTFDRKPMRRRHKKPPAPGKTGRVADWHKWLEQRNQGNYFKWRLAHKVGLLAGDILAYRASISPEMAAAELDEGNLEVPQDLMDYIRAGRNLRSVLRYDVGSSSIFGRKQKTPLDMEPERALSILEQRLNGETPDGK